MQVKWYIALLLYSVCYRAFNLITMQTEKGIWKISNGKGDRIYINCTDESKIMHPQKLCGTVLGIYGYKHLKDLAIAILLFEKEKQNNESIMGEVDS